MNSPDTFLNPRTRPAICEAHGEFVSRTLFRDTWSRCPHCADELKEKEAAERVSREQAEALERWQKRLGHAGIPERFRDRTLASFVADSDAKRRALSFAVDYADNFADALETGRSAVFIGKIGTGKTHLACGIGLQIMQRNGHLVLFSTVMRAIRSIKDTWARGSEKTETEAIAALTNPHLLILDEIGVQFGSETEKLILFDVLNERYENHRPTLLLSNLDLQGVRTYLGERIFDRMREDGGEVVVFDWESHRGSTVSRK